MTGEEVNTRGSSGIAPGDFVRRRPGTTSHGRDGEDAPVPSNENDVLLKSSEPKQLDPKEMARKQFEQKVKDHFLKRWERDELEKAEERLVGLIADVLYSEEMSELEQEQIVAGLSESSYQVLSRKFSPGAEDLKCIYQNVASFTEVQLRNVLSDHIGGLGLSSEQQLAFIVGYAADEIRNSLRLQTAYEKAGSRRLSGVSMLVSDWGEKDRTRYVNFLQKCKDKILRFNYVWRQSYLPSQVKS